MEENPYATPNDTGDGTIARRPIGCRMVGGLILLTLGILLGARALWIRFFYWADILSEEFKARTIIALGFSLFLVLAGCWAVLGFRRAVWAWLVLWLFATIVSGFL